MSQECEIPPLNARHVERAFRWATAADDHIVFLSCLLKAQENQIKITALLPLQFDGKLYHLASSQLALKMYVVNVTLETMYSTCKDKFKIVFVFVLKTWLCQPRLSQHICVIAGMWLRRTSVATVLNVVSIK